MTGNKLLTWASALSLGPLMIAGAAYADLVVVDQKGTSYAKDQKLSDDAALDVKRGARLTLKRLPDGTDHTIEGPFTGVLGSYKAKANCSTWDVACKLGFGESSKKEDVAPVPGGTRGPVESAPGGTRGTQAPE